VLVINLPTEWLLLTPERKRWCIHREIGYYDPKPEEYQYKIDHERALYWLEQGAIPSDTVKSLLKKEGILKKVSRKQIWQSNI